MTEEQLARLRALVAEWQPKLGLQRWEIHCTFIAPRSTGTAQIQVDHFRLHAMIRVSDDQPEESWTAHVVHELLHLVVDPWSHLTLKLIQQLPAGAQELAEVWRHDAEEGVIERLTDALSGPQPFPKSMKTSWREVE